MISSFRKILLLVMLVCTCIQMQAQYSQQNSFIRKAIVSYSKDSKGFYVKTTDVMLDVVNNVKENYAYDKKAQNLYVVTPTSNVVITLNKDYAKIIKKNKDIPQLKDEVLDSEIARQTQLLEEKFARLNAQREQFLKDSIQKVREDSIAEVRKQEALVAAQNQKREDYRQQHKYQWIPTGGKFLNCTICDKSINDSIVYSFGIANDSIFFLKKTEGKLGLSYIEPHKAKIPSSMWEDEDFKFHYEVFKDSLTNDSTDYNFIGYYWSTLFYEDYQKEIKKIAPYGFFEEWGWDDEYSMLTFNFRYTNTNAKTIKYITVYFKVTNDVGDIRKTGSFRGTGPLAEGESASWNWDSSSYYVSGDATKMSITKVVLTYMNGKTQVVTGNYLRFN